LERFTSGSKAKQGDQMQATINHVRNRFRLAYFFVVIALLAMHHSAIAQDNGNDISNKLQGFDAYMEKVLKDWNAPAVGVGIVVNDKLVFAKGYGYRDYEKKHARGVQVSGCGETGWRSVRQDSRRARRAVDSVQGGSSFE
jgi:hypothetical protein